MTKADHKSAFLYYEDDILTAVIKPNVDLGIEEMAELLEFTNQFTNYKKRYTIIDTRSEYNSKPEVQKFYAEHESVKYRYADAFIVNSLPMRILVNFYIRFHKPKIPTKLFNNMEAAKIWIEQLKKASITH